MKVTICNVCENIISPFLFEYKDGDIAHIDIYQLYKEKNSNVVAGKQKINLDICPSCSKKLKNFLYNKKS